MKIIQKLTNIFSSLYLKMIGTTVVFMLLFSSLLVLIGYFAFTASFTKEYRNSVVRTASIAAGWTYPDEFDKYLELGDEKLNSGYENITRYNKYAYGDDTPIPKDDIMYVTTYGATKEGIIDLCNDMNMSVIYAIIPDEDYENYTCVYNCLNDNSTYDPWPVGYRTKASSEEYVAAFKNIYEHDSEEEIVNRLDEEDTKHPHITALVPIKDENGKIYGIMCSQRYVDELIDTRHTFVQGVGAITVIIIVFGVLLFARFIKKELVNPVQILVKETDRFANDNTKGDTILTDDISSITEVQRLAMAINKMEDDTVKNIENITEYTKQSERIGYELELASKIQLGMLPNKKQFEMDRDGFDIYAIMRPAKEVGGDFYDFFRIDEDHVAFLVADVSDKGVGAAFFMTVSKTLLKIRADLGGTAKEVITYVDKLISEKNESGMFVTVWLGIIDLRTGHVNSCNAGHDYPAILRNREEGFVIEKTPHGPPVCFLPGVEFVEYDFDLKPNDRIFLYTDGLNEAKNTSGERFGLDRVVEVLNENMDENNEETLIKMRMAVDEFVGEEPQFDDMTMLGFTYLGRE